MLMIRGNIRDLLKDNLSTDDEPYCIYVVRTADAVLYVGRSVDPVNRLLEHISQNPASLPIGLVTSCGRTGPPRFYGR